MGSMKSWIKVLGVGLVVTASSIASAASVQMSDLVAGGTITSGNLTFSNFSFFPGSDFSTPLDETEVFDIDGGILIETPILITGTSIADAALSFTVTSTAPITSAALRSVGSVFNGPGNIAIAETITSGSDTLGSLGNLYGNDVDEIVLDQVYFAGATTLNVTKDIALFPNGGSVFLSDIYQTFTTDGSTVIPTPSAVLAGLVGLGFVVSRRRNRAELN